LCSIYGFPIFLIQKHQSRFTLASTRRSRFRTKNVPGSVFIAFLFSNLKHQSSFTLASIRRSRFRTKNVRCAVFIAFLFSNLKHQSSFTLASTRRSRFRTKNVRLGHFLHVLLFQIVILHRCFTRWPVGDLLYNPLWIAFKLLSYIGVSQAITAHIMLLLCCELLSNCYLTSVFHKKRNGI